MSPATVGVAPARDTNPQPGKSRRWLLFIAVLFIVIVALVLRQRRPASSQVSPIVTARTQITYDGLAKSSVLSAGSNLYVTEATGGRHVISQVTNNGSATSAFPNSFPNIEALDVSSDGSQLLASALPADAADQQF